MPEPSSAHAAAGLEMEVEPRSVDVLARGLVRKVRGGGGLVRAFVPRKARVPVNAEHRAADRPRIGVEIPADLAQTRAEVGNEPKHRLLHIRFVSVLVLLKPGSVVVGLELLQKLKESRTEAGGGRSLPLTSIRRRHAILAFNPQ